MSLSGIRKDSMKRVFILCGQRNAPDTVTDETYKLMAAHFLNIGNEARPTAHSYVTACGSQDIIVNWSQVAQLVCYDEEPEDDRVTEGAAASDVWCIKEEVILAR